MNVNRNQKENYIQDYYKECIAICLSLAGHLSPEHKKRIEESVNRRRQAVDEVFCNGILDGLGNLSILPTDIVYVDNSEKVAQGYYWLVVSKHNREKLYPIRFYSF